MIRKLVATVCLFVAALPASADWTEYGELTNVRLYGGSVILGGLSTMDSTHSQLYCGGTNNAGEFSFKLEEPYADQLLSFLLLAEAAGRNVKVDFTGNCEGGRAEINAISLQDNA